MRILVFLDLIAGAHEDKLTSPFAAGPQHSIFYYPFFGVTKGLLQVYHDPATPIPQWIDPG